MAVYPFPALCPEKVCYENSYKHFAGPAPLVKLALQNGLISDGMRVLEVGGGCLRNSLYLQREFKKLGWTSQIEVADITASVERFASDHRKFKGKVHKDTFPKRPKYDVIFTVFMAEALCPRRNRVHLLSCIHRALKNGGRFLVTFRGHQIVNKASSQRPCHEGEGYWTDAKTYACGHNVAEAEALLAAGGFAPEKIRKLQAYRTPAPEYVRLEAGK